MAETEELSLDKPTEIHHLLSRASFAASPLPKPALEARSAQRTVLLVDDDADFLLAIAETLRDEGHQVIEARSGEGALAVLDRAAEARELAPDLIVLDLLMPRMSGIEFLQRLRKSVRWGQLPV